MDQRLHKEKDIGRAMQSYVLTLYEFVLEIRPKKVLEIGVQRGQSTKSMLMAIGENGFGKLVSVDHKTRGDILDYDYADLKPYWTCLKGSSHDPRTLQAVKDQLEEGELFDMAFIDGDHKYDGVKQDWEDYTQLVKPGGVIILHDIINKNEGVKDLWKEITWEKFALDWGRARQHVIPGLGLVKKPYEEKS